MLRRLTVVLSEQERQALHLMAETEMREPREQVRFLVREEARRRGLLESAILGECITQASELRSERSVYEQR